MKFSEGWLREWVDPGVDTDGLCDQLTGAGLEVDGVVPAHPGFEGVVVGTVLESEPHPTSGRLRVCTVDDGAGTVAVVCGAPNVRVGVKAPLARVGARLPGIAVAAREIQGVVSDGMLCSAAELDLGEDADGILELPARWRRVRNWARARARGPVHRTGPDAQPRRLPLAARHRAGSGGAGRRAGPHAGLPGRRAHPR